MRVAVLGAGAWGTAIACVLGARHETVLWARDAAQARLLAQTRRNERYLRGTEIPAGVAVTGDLAEATSGISLALVATPVAGLREILQKVKPPLVWLCKGFEQGSGTRSPQRFSVAMRASARSPDRRSLKKWRAACPAR
jgi:glycerol-3-phosphate dehydrogenase (NAD(P)+)